MQYASLIMKRMKWLLIVGVVSSLSSFATTLPIDEAVLNFTQVMFEFDEKPGADTYILTLIPAKAAMMKKARYVNKSLACLVTEDIEFGKRYGWYYEAFKNGKPVFRSQVYHFSVAKHPLVGSNYRYNIITKETGKFSDGLVYIESLGVAINRSGQPVWYLPFDTGSAFKMPQYRNLEMTKEGTVTALQGEQAFEKNLYGELLWKAPDNGAVSGDGKEHYHHDFAKMDDGTYVVCSYKWDTTMHFYHDTVVTRVRYNSVIQYNPFGEVLWSWNEKEHVNKSEIFTIYKQPDAEVAGTHMNGFSYDKKTNSFLFSFRDNSSVLRVDKATGNVLYSLKGADGPIEFHSQHSPVVLEDGSVLIYNNNAGFNQDSGKITYPSILNVLVPTGNGVAKKIWEYECKMKQYPLGLIGKEGYASELPNKNLLVCIGGANKIFELSRAKQITWEMNCEELNQAGQWTGFNNYRAHFSSSLYPHYFTIQNVAGDTILTAGKPIHVKLNNDGTEADEFKIEVFSNNLLNNYSTVVKLKPQSSITKKILLAKKSAAKTKNDPDNFVVVSINSVSNPAAVKTITYIFK